MKRNYLLIGCIAVVVLASSCSRVRRNPGRAYMPDMAYSRAYETYASTEELKKKGINYTAMPVVGTIAREDLSPYTLVADTTGMYSQSASTRNPLDSLVFSMKEAERLYLVNCAICHGADLKGDGPLFNGGAGPYAAKPAILVGDPRIDALPEGTLFHVVSYGKNAMGSYASQMSELQRWMVVRYVKSKQGSSVAKPATTTDTTSATGQK
jgi:mono/diheme cytochrome c family protein